MSSKNKLYIPALLFLSIAVLLIYLYLFTDKENETVNNKHSGQTHQETNHKRDGDSRAITTRSGGPNKSASHYLEEIDRLQVIQNLSEKIESQRDVVYRASNELGLNEFIQFTENLVGTPLFDLSSSLLASKFAIEDPEKGIQWISSYDSQSGLAAMEFARAMKYTSFPETHYGFLESDVIKSSSFIKGIISSGNVEAVKVALKKVLENPRITKFLSQTNGAFLQDSANQFIENKDINSFLAVMESFPDDSLDRSAIAYRIFSSEYFDPKISSQSIPLTSGSDRQKAIDGLVTRWVRDDPVAVSEWIDELDNAQDVDFAKKSVSEAMFDINLLDAAEWAKSVSGNELRDTLLRKIIHRAEVTNPDLAEEMNDLLTPQQE